MTNNIVNSKLFLNKFSNREKIYKFKNSNFSFFVQNNLRTSIQNFQVCKNNAKNQQTMSRVHNHNNSITHLFQELTIELQNNKV